MDGTGDCSTSEGASPDVLPLAHNAHNASRFIIKDRPIPLTNVTPLFPTSQHRLPKIPQRQTNRPALERANTPGNPMRTIQSSLLLLAQREPGNCPWPLQEFMGGVRILGVRRRLPLRRLPNLLRGDL